MAIEFTLSLGGGSGPMVGMAVIGAILLAGGAMLYRGTETVALRVLAGASIAAGAVVWAFLLYVTPVAAVRGG